MVTTHGLTRTKDERNEAIVRLYSEGWKQEALAQMWQISQQQISDIIRADERTERIQFNCKTTQKLSPTHEHIIRRAPEPFQDDVAGKNLLDTVHTKENNYLKINARILHFYVNVFVHIYV